MCFVFCFFLFFSFFFFFFIEILHFLGFHSTLLWVYSKKLLSEVCWIKSGVRFRWILGNGLGLNVGWRVCFGVEVFSSFRVIYKGIVCKRKIKKIYTKMSLSQIEQFKKAKKKLARGLGQIWVLGFRIGGLGILG